MAKVTFSKLGLKVDTKTSTFTWNNMDITVKHYLPIMQKAELVEFIVNHVVDDHDYENPLMKEIYTTMGMIMYYTDISFTDKQKEDMNKTYDACESSGLWSEVACLIPMSEKAAIISAVNGIIDSLYDYKHSAAGIMELLATDYKDLNFDISAITEKISDPDNLALLKGIAKELG